MLKFERAYIPAEEIDNGPLPARYLSHATAIAFAIFSLSLLPLWQHFTWVQGLMAAGFSIVLARLLAIDLCHLLLPNIYVLPLLLIAPLAAPLLGPITWLQSLIGAAVAAGIGIGILAILSMLKRPNEIGMGDIKFLLVMGAWLGAAALPIAMAISCFMGLVLSFLTPRGQAFPFGPALIIGFWACLFYAKPLEGLLIRLISLIP